MKPWEDHLKTVTFLNHKPSPLPFTHLVEEIDFTECDVATICNYNDNNDKIRSMIGDKYRSTSGEFKNRNTNNKDRSDKEQNNGNLNEINKLNKIDKIANEENKMEKRVAGKPTKVLVSLFNAKIFLKVFK